MTDFAERVLKWYAQHGRSLPWRGTADPYAVWVSEIMLQQTRVEAVIPYFERWMRLFPSIQALAQAGEQEVLAAWEGLGYYSRARNLHRAARLMVEQHAGQLPRDPEALRQLPGIGRYTLGAIASIAFGLDLPALDGNLKRVFARVFDVEQPVDSPAGEKRLWELVAENLPAGRAGDYHQGLMDIGAGICLPRRPRCLLCPLLDMCRARQIGVEEARPVKKPRRETPHYTVTAAVIRRGPKVLLARRPAKGLLGGLWEYPGGKVEAGEELAQALQREIGEELGSGLVVGDPFGVYRHAYTHFRITLHAFLCKLTGAPPQALEAEEIRWVPLSELDQYPMGKVDRLISRRLQEGRSA
jgi:A/G-specific adenine glycosylase